MAMGIYGWPKHEDKHHTWKLIRKLKGSTTLPTLFFGDFNDILVASEKQGGGPRRESQITAFRVMIHKCGLYDLGLLDTNFTWQLE